MAGAYGMKGMVAPNAGGTGGGIDILGLIQKLFSMNRPGSPIDQVVRPFPQGTPQGPQVSSGVPGAADALAQLAQRLFVNPLASPAAGSPIDRVLRPSQGNAPVGPSPGPPAQATPDDFWSQIADAAGGALPAGISAAAQAPVAGGDLLPTPQGPPTPTGEVAAPPPTAQATPADTAQSVADTAIASDSGADDTSGASDTEDASDTVAADEATPTEADTAGAAPDASVSPTPTPSGYQPDYPYPQMMPSDQQPPMTDMSNSAIADFINSMVGGDTGTPADGSVVKASRALPPAAGGPAMGSGAAIHAPIVNVDVGSKLPDHQPGYMGRAAQTVQERGSTAQQAAGGAKRSPTEAFVMDQATQTARRERGNTPDVTASEPSARDYGGRTGAGGGGTGEGRPNTTYTIKKGDSLYRIAQRVYGDPNRWREIARANKLSVRNPNRIFTGQTLVLPGPAGGPTPTVRPTRYTDQPNTEGGIPPR